MACVQYGVSVWLSRAPRGSENAPRALPVGNKQRVNECLTVSLRLQSTPHGKRVELVAYVFAAP